MIAMHHEAGSANPRSPIAMAIAVASPRVCAAMRTGCPISAALLAWVTTPRIMNWLSPRRKPCALGGLDSEMHVPIGKHRFLRSAKAGAGLPG